MPCLSASQRIYLFIYCIYRLLPLRVDRTGPGSGEAGVLGGAGVDLERFSGIPQQPLKDEMI